MNQGLERGMTMAEPLRQLIDVGFDNKLETDREEGWLTWEPELVVLEGMGICSSEEVKKKTKS